MPSRQSPEGDRRPPARSPDAGAGAAHTGDVAAPAEELELALPPAPPPDERTSARRRRHPGPWPWAAAAAALVLAGTVLAPTPGAVVVRTDDPLSAGVIDATLARAAAPAWRLPVAAAQVQVLAGTAVVTRTDGRLAGYALTDGALRWTTRPQESGCQVGRQVVCVTAAGTPDATIERHDPASGASTSTAHPYAVAAIDVGTDLVVVDVAGTGSSVTRLGEDGTARWRTDPGALSVVTADPTHDGVVARWVMLQVLGRNLTSAVLSGGRLDLDTGVITPVRSLGYALGADGRITSVTAELADGSEVTEIEVGSATVPLRPDEPVLVADDDVRGPVALRLEGGSGADARLVVELDGTRTLWQRDLAAGYPMARLDGVLVTSLRTGDGGVLTGTDITSGEARWTLTGGYDVVGAGGGAVLLVSPTTDEVAAVGVRTGRVRWSVRLPGPLAQSPLVDDGGLLLSTGSELVRYTW